MSKTNTILVAPLDWGLGHATRSIPLIRELEKRENRIILASNGRSALLLKQEFPHLKLLTPPDYAIDYPTGGNMIWHMLRKTPKLLKTIRKEHIWLENMIDQEKITHVISDNRYGCWSKRVKTVFITHQLHIKASKLRIVNRITNSVNRHFINRFEQVWIPDFQGNASLAGSLSQTVYGLKKRPQFIGPLSRFNAEKSTSEAKHILAIISGPEPQRTQFEEMITNPLVERNASAIVLKGKPEEQEVQNIGNVKLLSHCSTAEFQKLISEAHLVISRSGYSTVMDLAQFGKRALFIPTPGQTEQIYIAQRLSQKGFCHTVEQGEKDLNQAIDHALEKPGIPQTLQSNVQIKSAIDLLLYPIQTA